jgi:hypothetical protein
VEKRYSLDEKAYIKIEEFWYKSNCLNK